jgi:hypothetical protein
MKPVARFRAHGTFVIDAGKISRTSSKINTRRRHQRECQLFVSLSQKMAKTLNRGVFFRADLQSKFSRSIDGDTRESLNVY